MLPDQSFRDSLSTVGKDGKRVWVYPRKPSGKLHTWRVIVSVVLLAALFGAPFVKVNGLPLFLFNIIERKFVLFGFPFWPQDFFIIVIAFVTMVVFIILFTIVYGRIFCGWVCPQTVFMEMVFRKIEYLIEGDFMQQKMLDKLDWTEAKVLKKTVKHIAFFSVSFLISNTFLAYIIGIDQLWVIITDDPSKHMVGLFAILLFSGVFYWVFAFFREQVCTIACPYGRLQGVMLDKNSIVVAYDYVRGEPREKLHKNVERTSGDCIECMQCVQVCPTGIDIRNGTQLECVNCTACIDACDSIMEHIGKPKGLIRYDSEKGIAEKIPLKINTRILAYSVVLVALLGVLTTLLLLRSEVDATIVRTAGMLYQTKPNGNITNLYKAAIVNKTVKSIPVELKLEGTPGKITLVGNATRIIVPEQGISDAIFFVEIRPEDLKKVSSTIKIGVYSHGKLLTSESTRFLGPAK